MKKSVVMSMLTIAMFAPLTTWGAPPAALPAKKMLAYWNFDEGKGSECHDLSGNRHHLKILHNMRGVKWVDGRRGKALHFISSNGKNHVAGAAVSGRFVYDFSTGFTLECWVKMDADARLPRSIYYIFNNSPGNCGPGFNIYYNSGYYMISCGNGSKYWKETGWSAEARIPDLRNRWVHLAATFDGQTAKVYVDGKLLGQRDNARYYKHERWAAVCLGSGWNGLTKGYPGAIDEVKIYNYARTAEEIIQAAKFDM